MIAKLVKDYPVSVVWQVLSSNHTSYYCTAQGRDDTMLIVTIWDVEGQWPRYGYRRMTKQLRRDKMQVIDTERVRCVMTKMGLQAKNERRACRSHNLRRMEVMSRWLR